MSHKKKCTFEKKENRTTNKTNVINIIKHVLEIMFVVDHDTQRLTMLATPSS